MTTITINAENRPVTLYTAANPVQAELVKNLLLGHGIECQLDGEHQAGFTGALEVGVMVSNGDIAEATEILKFHHADDSLVDEQETDAYIHSYLIQGGIYETEESINAFRLDR
jgi:hypothetical protein